VYKKVNKWPKYSIDEIKKFNSEDNFMEAHVELLKQTIELLLLVVEHNYFESERIPKELSRDDAVKGGNLVRLIKLNTSFLQNCCEGKLEICYILIRCLAETAINIMFLIAEGEKSVIKNYIKNSLITEKELWQTIISNLNKRNGNILPIEERMKTSILDSFNASDLDINDVNKSSKWKSIKERANIVAGDMFYKVFYGSSSHAIHGNWQDILFHNLKKNDNGFQLNMNWNRPRPQILAGAISLNIDVIRTLGDHKSEDDSKANELKEISQELSEYLLELDYGHEKWIVKS
jgi:hypothetical protein